MSETHSNRAAFSESDANAPGELRQDASEFDVIFVHSRLDDYGLPVAAFRVYCHLARRGGRNGAWPSVANIARVCGLHPQTVRKALQLLTKHRLVLREDRPGLTALYHLTPASAWRPLKRIDDPSETDTAPSVSKGSLAKRVQGRASEMDTAKGNPSEGNPKKGVQIQFADLLPISEVEAVKEAQTLGVPSDFAQQEFTRMVSVGWLDGCRRPIKSWPHYIKQRWSKEQSERGERRAGSRSPGKLARPPRHFHSGDYDQPI